MVDLPRDVKLPAFAAIGLTLLGLVIATLQGSIVHGSMLGGFVALAGAIPACYGMWKGIQQEGQTALALSVVSILLSLGIAGVLIILRVVHWLR